MTKLKNLIYLLVFGGVLVSLKFFVVNKEFGKLPHDADVWFTSGLLLIILGIFVTEKYFTRSLDVLVNIITLGVVLLSLDDPTHFRLWSALLFYGVSVGLFALISFILFNEEQDQNLFSQKVAHSISIVARFLGSSRMLFSIVFILSLFNYFVFSLEQGQLITSQQVTIIALIIFWVAALQIESIDLKLIQPFINAIGKKNRTRVLGKVIKRMSPNVIVIENYPNAPILRTGDIAFLDDIHNSHKSDQSRALMFAYSEDTCTSRQSYFYSLDQINEEISKQIYVYLLSDTNNNDIQARVSETILYQNKEDIIGLISTGSDIDIIKIRLIEGIDDKKRIKEGDLVSVNVYGESTKYQIINAETAIESVDSQSKQGIKIVTAQQIGFWENNKKRFEDTGWVPEINSPVFLEKEDSAEIQDTDCSSYRVGIIPKSKYPIYLNFTEAVSHHVAIIGKTGTGKSYMAAKIIEKLANDNYKVVILEIDQVNKQSLSRYINQDLISPGQTTWSAQNKSKTVSGRSVPYTEWKASTNLSATDGKKVFIINWENQSQNKDDGPLSQTDGAVAIITDVIQYQSQNPDEKICIVMEEAYDFIPETTFGQQDFGQPGVSRVSQLVLKCRKHNIGFLIITQRTALVTKTILYQCHTIIALQSFDETSRTFMSAYINQRYLDSMSILPRYRAIVVGKGSSCDKPVIVNFFDKKFTSNTPE